MEKHMSSLEWAVVELKSGRIYGGQINDTARYGVHGLRIAIPNPDPGVIGETHYYSEDAIMSAQICSERAARLIPPDGTTRTKMGLRAAVESIEVGHGEAGQCPPTNRIR